MSKTTKQLPSPWANSGTEALAQTDFKSLAETVMRVYHDDRPFVHGENLPTDYRHVLENLYDDQKRLRYLDPDVLADIAPDKNWLSKQRVMVASPMLNGMNHGPFTNACLDIKDEFYKYGIAHSFEFHFNRSVIVHARNALIRKFLESGFDYLLFLDSDQWVYAPDIAALLMLSRKYRGILGGLVPFKEFNWKKIIAIAKYLDGSVTQDDEKLAQLFGVAGAAPVAFRDHAKPLNLRRPIEMRRIGTGYMLLPRYVLDEIAKTGKVRRYSEGGEEFQSFFELMINDKGYWVSEDYVLCDRWHDLGGKIWACPWFISKHIGQVAFEYNARALQQLAEISGKDDLVPKFLLS